MISDPTDRNYPNLLGCPLDIESSTTVNSRCGLAGR